MDVMTIPQAAGPTNADRPVRTVAANSAPDMEIHCRPGEVFRNQTKQYITNRGGEERKTKTETMNLRQ